MAVRNAGIVGGRRAVFEGALSTVVNRMAGLTEIGDMVAWNEVALTQGDRLITGYPRGPTNLPMYGKLMPEHKCPRLCRHKWLNETRGMYWCGPFSPCASHSQSQTPPAKAHPNVSARWAHCAQVWAQATRFLVQIRGLPPLRLSFSVRPARCLFYSRDNGRAI